MSNNYDFALDMQSKNSLSIILSKIKKGSLVLEFGCAHGRMSRYLKEVLECKVYGVEIDEEAARSSKAYMEELVVENIGSFGWLDRFGGLRFDVVIFADVLEHLVEPAAVLTKAATLLKEDGVVYVSIPNITHNCVVMELFKEQFEYQRAGLLDSTHLRFFSYYSFKELCAQSGLSVVFEDAVVVVPELSEFSHRYEELPCYVGDYLQSREYGEVYQFVFGLQKSLGEFHVEKLSIVSQPQRYLELMINSGNGYGEEIQRVYVAGEAKSLALEFSLEAYEKIAGLRLDPLNRCVVVALEEIRLVLESGEEILLTCSMSNAKHSFKGKDYFTTYDPIYHLDLKEREFFDAKCLRVVISYSEKSYVEIFEEIINGLENTLALRISKKLTSFFDTIYRRRS